MSKHLLLFILILAVCTNVFAQQTKSISGVVYGLDQCNRLICDRRKRNAYHLRQNYAHRCLYTAQPQHLARLILSPVDCQQAAAENFCKICRIIEGKAEQCANHRRLQRRFEKVADKWKAVVNKKQLKHQRRPTHDIYVCVYDPAQRSEAASRDQCQQKAKRHRCGHDHEKKNQDRPKPL